MANITISTVILNSPKPENNIWFKEYIHIIITINNTYFLTKSGHSFPVSSIKLWLTSTLYEKNTLKTTNVDRSIIINYSTTSQQILFEISQFIVKFLKHLFIFHFRSFLLQHGYKKHPKIPKKQKQNLT